MIYTTDVSKKSHCPMWDININIRGKYRLSDSEETLYQATFMRAYCPIIENIHLPVEKRDKELSYYPYCRINDCPCLKGFKKTIDIRKDGYSQ